MLTIINYISGQCSNPTFFSIFQGIEYQVRPPMLKIIGIREIDCGCRLARVAPLTMLAHMR